MNVDKQRAAGETLAAQDMISAVKENIIVDKTVPSIVLHEKLVNVNGTIIMPCLIDSGSSSYLFCESATKSNVIQWKNHTAVIYEFDAQAVTKMCR